jgi:hypothetical protein
MQSGQYQLWIWTPFYNIGTDQYSANEQYGYITRTMDSAASSATERNPGVSCRYTFDLTTLTTETYFQVWVYVSVTRSTVAAPSWRVPYIFLTRMSNNSP